MKKKLPKMRNRIVMHMIKRKCGAHKKTHKQLRGKLNRNLE